MPELPPELLSRQFIQDSLRSHLLDFYDPRHWRIPRREVKRARVKLLRFSPPFYDVLLTIRARRKSLQFYEALAVKQKVRRGELVKAEVEIEGDKVYLVDGYTCRAYVKGILEDWCNARERDAIGFTGKFLGMEGEVEVRIRSLQPLFKRDEEVTTNYLYRCKGSLLAGGGRRDFDVVIKRFLPREPVGRGNREYALLGALPPSIVPKVWGGVVNKRVRVDGAPQVLVLFLEFLQNVELGDEIWRLMNEVIRLKERGLSYGRQFRLLLDEVGKAVRAIIFPFHLVTFERWHPKTRELTPRDEFYKKYFSELTANLSTLEGLGLLGPESKGWLEVFREAWRLILRKIPVTEIHGDMMWRQILKTKGGRLVIIDLDEHMPGHAAKDLADLCAANRFISEVIPCVDRGFARELAKRLNEEILRSYLAEARGAKWVKNLKQAVKIYLAYRHLHDAAYFAPIWSEALGKKKKTYEAYVKFSMAWARRCMKELEALVKA